LAPTPRTSKSRTDTSHPGDSLAERHTVPQSITRQTTVVD